jgi:transglutaminase-like putative cysteine protease
MTAMPIWKWLMIPGLCLWLHGISAYAQGSTYFDQVRSKWTIQADGLSVEELLASLRTPEGDGTGVFVVPLDWNAALEKLQVVDARLVKADGHELELSRDAIREETPGGDALFHEYSRIHRLILTFSDVQAGDHVIIQTRRQAIRTSVPGGFWIARLLSMPAGSVDYTVSVPTSLPFHAEAIGLDHQSEVIVDRTVHYFHATRVRTPEAGRAYLGGFDHFPRLVVSTFKDWPTFARDYGSLLLPHATVTPAVRALATKLTAGLTDPRDRARALYDWVRDNIHYVDIPLEQSRLEPFDAEQVMRRLRGDTKDHAVLLTALLEASGIQSAILLLNNADDTTISDVPALSPMNHLILYLPGPGIYLDSTLPGAPFGVLPFEELGKPAIALNGTGPTHRTIPVPPAGETDSSLVTDATFGVDGTVTGTTTTTARGAFAVQLHAAAKAMGTRTEVAATTVLLGHQTPGSGTFAPGTEDPSGQAFTLRGTFSIPGQASYLSGGYFTLWTGLRILPRAGDFLVGPIAPPDWDTGAPVFCYPGRQREQLSLKLPPGHEIGGLPSDLTIDNTLIHYHAHWALEGRRLTVTREFESHIPGPVCDRATRAKLAPLLRKIHADVMSVVGFER